MDLRSESEDERWAQKLADDGWQAVELTARQEAICKFAEKLTLEPAKMNDEDISGLRGIGLNDADVLDVVQATSYFNYINRVADALGVPPEPDWN